MALVMGLAALTATASESDLVRDIQRYCTVCWKNARLDPGLWDDCTQEVCCRLLTKARAGALELNLVLDDDTPERRELIRAIDMVRKRVQRSKRFQSLDDQLRVRGLIEEQLGHPVDISAACGLGRRTPESGLAVLHRTAELLDE